MGRVNPRKICYILHSQQNMSSIAQAGWLGFPGSNGSILWNELQRTPETCENTYMGWGRGNPFSQDNTSIYAFTAGILKLDHNIRFQHEQQPCLCVHNVSGEIFTQTGVAYSFRSNALQHNILHSLILHFWSFQLFTRTYFNYHKLPLTAKEDRAAINRMPTK